MARLVTATEHNHLRLIPRTHSEGKNLFPQVVLCPPCVYVHTHEINVKDVFSPNSLKYILR